MTYLDPLPNIVNRIGNAFMDGCHIFNQEIIIHENINRIGVNFLFNNYGFDKKITIPNNVNLIGVRFMHGCQSFTGPLELLIDDIGIFATSSDLSHWMLSVVKNNAVAYTTGITITGNITGAQLKSIYPNLNGLSKDGYKFYRNIL